MFRSTPSDFVLLFEDSPPETIPPPKPVAANLVLVYAGNFIEIQERKISIFPSFFFIYYKTRNWARCRLRHSLRHSQRRHRRLLLLHKRPHRRRP